ncbi:metallophosphoesterase [Anderseniella sp. Alg231-50]|uniref:metallophosphoesterase n=1 Tax=Anderseniella sp. Alg231-50 TaxID=1922226 RepID=UPI000D5597C4
MKTIIYAIGDIHGRDDLLKQLHENINAYHRSRYPEAIGEIVHVGDYIDGGAHSVEVIDRLMRGTEGFDSTCLLGNHEAMMLECLETDNRQAWYTWLSNGGDETLTSLGISLRFGGYDPSALGKALGEERVSWLHSLPLYRVVEPYLFVHAGIAPGVPLEEQQTKDLLWIRSRFLESDADHGHVVVHGHTPGDEPFVKPNRICIDTGATSNGLLTAAVLDGVNPPLFLRATGRPGKTG